MKHPLRPAVLIAALATLVACGGSAPLAPTKEATAQAVYTVGQGAKGARGAVSPLADFQALARSQPGIPFQADVTSSCAKEGKVTLKISSVEVDLSDTAATTLFNMSMVYDNCTHDGKSRMTGTLATSLITTTAAAGASVVMGMKGKVTLTGEVEDFLDMDINQSMEASSLEASSGKVGIYMQGKVTTSSGTYTFNNEVVAVSPGSFIRKD